MCDQIIFYDSSKRRKRISCISSISLLTIVEKGRTIWCKVSFYNFRKIIMQQIGFASPIVLAWLFLIVYEDELKDWYFKYWYRTSFFIAYGVFWLWEVLAVLLLFLFAGNDSFIPSQIPLGFIVLLIIAIIGSWMVCKKILFKKNKHLFPIK